MTDAVRQIVAVDPGLNGCGLAILDRHGFVEHAELVANPLGPGSDLPARWEAGAVAVAQAVARATKVPRSQVARTLIVEMPRVNLASRQKGSKSELDPNVAILPLVGVVATVIALGSYESRRLISPRDWKGTIDADEMVRRVQKRLFPRETENVRLPTAESLQHNVWDAIGIALHVVGRLEPKKVIAR